MDDHDAGELNVSGTLMLTVPAQAQVDLIEVMVKVIDNLRADAELSEGQRDEGLSCAKGLLGILLVKSGPRFAVGVGTTVR